MAFRIGAIILLFLLVGPARADQLRNAQFGFTLELPPGFKPNPAGQQQDVIHSFLLGDATDDQPDIAFNVRRMRGTFPVTQRLKREEMPKTPGMKMELQEMKCMGYTLDKLKGLVTLQDGRQLVTYTLQVPLKPEAIELGFGGLLEREMEITAFMDKVVASFTSDRINQGTSPTIELVKMTTDERVQKLVEGGGTLCLFLIGVVWLMRKLFGKKSPPSPPRRPPSAA